MDRVNGFFQIWHTSSCSQNDSTRVTESHVTTSSDLTFSFDFPIPRESYVTMPLAKRKSPAKKINNRKSHNASSVSRALSERQATVFDTNFQTNFQPTYCHYDYSNNRTTSEVNRTITSYKSWKTTTKIAEACQEFSGISTFHGMRFVCAKNYNIYRRVVWVVLVVSCLLALGMQVYQQVSYFYSNPKSVSVEEKREDFVKFPAVTFCNENTFKITAAVEAGWLELVARMMNFTLTPDYLERDKLGDIPLDQLNLRLGNGIETMLLKCKWGNEACGVANFTSILTDRGLCYTFNGPENAQDMKVTTPGNAKVLRLTLNVEEYERMAGPNPASGIHILVHMKKTYPLVEQFGQAVAAGSHTFMAISLSKDIRLGPPYDSCETGQLIYVSNVTYEYDWSACKTDCFVKFVVDRCGCKDYFMPGNFSVCTFNQYLSCLRQAQQDYPNTAEGLCKCTTPCKSESVETSYSYAALSKSAMDKVKTTDMEDIKRRYMKALDTEEYTNKDNKIKKEKYKRFSGMLHTVTVLYSNVTDMLTGVKTYLLKLRNFTSNLYAVKVEFISTQEFVVQNYFVAAKDQMDETTLGEIADDIYVVSQGIRNRINALGTSPDKAVRDVQYAILKELLEGRIWLAGLALRNLTQLILAYKEGQPIFNVPLPDKGGNIVTFHWDDVIPRELLKEAWDRLEVEDDGRNASVCASVETVIYYMEAILVLAEDVYEARNITAEQEEDVQNNTGALTESCVDYLQHRNTFYTEVIHWPLAELEKAAVSIKAAKQKCETFFHDVLVQMDKLLDLSSEDYLATFKFADHLLQDYVQYWNVTKFEIIDLLLNNTSKFVLSDVESKRKLIENYVGGVNELWSNLDTCLFEMIQGILENEPLTHVFESKPELFTFGNFENLRLRKNITDQIRLNFSSLDSLIEEHRKMEESAQDIITDLKAFQASSVIDSSFYSKNFIFLDVYFTDISYIVTEHHVAYDVYKLLSDIGGSMGLLVGASAISLCEFLDLFCVIAAHVCRGSRKIGERFRNNSSLTSVYCQK